MSRRLLVIDDEPDIVEGIAWALEHAWRVEPAFDGVSALALLGEGTYAAALVDLNLPGMDGEEVIRCLRARLPELPVILVSASLDVDRVALEVGANAWIRKPFDVDHLESTIDRVVAAA